MNLSIAPPPILEPFTREQAFNPSAFPDGDLLGDLLVRWAEHVATFRPKGSEYCWVCVSASRNPQTGFDPMFTVTFSDVEFRGNSAESIVVQLGDVPHEQAKAKQRRIAELEAQLAELRK